MKSITKKIRLFLMLSAVLFLSSCLDSGSETYVGTEEYSYITQYGNTVFARTAGGHNITSEQMILLDPGSTVLLSYSITEETETIEMGENEIIYKVNLGSEPKKLDQSALQPFAAPVTDTVYFENIINPPTWATNSSAYFGDRWPITYHYKAKKGENIRINFYKVSEEDLPENFNDDVLIDIRIEKYGVPEVGAKSELKTDLIVANMSSLRGTPSDTESQEYKQLKVRFRYFRSDKEGELHISNETITIAVPK